MMLSIIMKLMIIKLKKKTICIYNLINADYFLADLDTEA